MNLLNPCSSHANVPSTTTYRSSPIPSPVGHDAAAAPRQTDTVLTHGNWRSLVTAGMLIASKVEMPRERWEREGVRGQCQVDADF